MRNKKKTIDYIFLKQKIYENHHNTLQSESDNVN